MSPLRPKRLGMLAPSSNTVLEPETVKLLPANGSVTAHVSRLRVVQVSAQASSLQQFDLDRVLGAAELLADAQVDLILWNGTAASWLGFDWDERLVEAVERHTGIRTTTAVIAINQRLAELRAKRIGLVTPYVAALEERIVANYRDAGVTVANAIRRDLTENTAIAEISPDEIAAMARQAARPPVEAVLILCTNLAGSSIVPQLEGELNVPVLDSVRVAIERCLDILAEAPEPA